MQLTKGNQLHNCYEWSQYWKPAFQHLAGELLVNINLIYVLDRIKTNWINTYWGPNLSRNSVIYNTWKTMIRQKPYSLKICLEAPIIDIY